MMGIDKSIYEWMSQEGLKISKMDNGSQREMREQLLHNILEQVGIYECYVYDYERNKRMSARGIRWNKCEYSCEQLKQLWDELFAADVSPADRLKIHYQQYLWHLFSYRKKVALEGQIARERFNQIQKDDVYIFYNDLEETYMVAGSEYLRDIDFDEEQDVYVMDLNNKWTYIHTHESDCGPYFYELI